MRSVNIYLVGIAVYIVLQYKFMEANKKTDTLSFVFEKGKESLSSFSLHS